jgi:hypothetical protein
LNGRRRACGAERQAANAETPAWLLMMSDSRQPAVCTQQWHTTGGDSNPAKWQLKSAGILFETPLVQRPISKNYTAYRYQRC